MLTLVANKYRPYVANRNFFASLGSAFGLLFVSIIVNFYAGLYATERASNFVTDAVLSNIRTFDVDGIFVYGSILFWVFVSFLCLAEPKRIPYVVKSVALFTFIRAIFISLTHIGPYPTHIVVDSDILSKFVFEGDLFFSGHTGFPFLLALIFWDERPLRFFFIASSVFFGIVVLLAHLHYSIDVLSAFFITYTINHIAEIIFPEDRQLFISGADYYRS